MKKEDLFKVIEIHKPSFCFEKIQPFPEEEWNTLQFFVKEHIWEESSINIIRVIGTKHPDYQNMTWDEFLHQGKRMRLNLELFEKNPDYYLDTVHKLPTMHYVQIDSGEYYVGADGNHSTCIAKFFFFLKGISTLHGVEIDHYLINHKALEIYRALKEKEYYPEPVLKKLSRVDSSGWMREKFETMFRLKDGRVVTVDEAERILEAKKQSRGGLFKKIWSLLAGQGKCLKKTK